MTMAHTIHPIGLLNLINSQSEELFNSSPRNAAAFTNRSDEALLGASGCRLGRRRAISTREKNTVLNMKFNDFTFIFRQIFMAEGCGRGRGGWFGGGVVEMNVNEQSGLFIVLIRWNNPKLIWFGLQRHAKVCIIRGRGPDVS